MKHFFNLTHIVTVALAAACVFGFSACNDEIAEQEKITQDVKEELQQEISDLNDSIDALEREVDDYVKAIQKANDSIQAQLNARIDSLGNVVSSITPCGCDFHHWQDVVDYVNATIQPYWDSTAVKNWVATQIGAFVTVTQLTDSLNNVRTTINTLSTRLDNVDLSITNINNDITNLNTRVTGAYAEIYRIRDSLATVTSNLEGTIAAVTTIATSALDTARISLIRADSAIVLANNAQAAADAAQAAADKAMDTARVALANANDAMDTAKVARATADMAYALALVNQTNITNINLRIDGLSSSIDTLRNTSAYLVALAKFDSARIDALENMYNNLKVRDDSLEHQIDTIKMRLLDYVTRTELHDSLTLMRVYADTLHAKSIRYADSLFNLIKDTLGTFDARITNLETAVPIIQMAVDSLKDSIAAHRAEIDSLAARVYSNTQRITNLEKAVVDLSTYMKDVFKKTIYSVILQGTYNPVFGYFATPFGIQNNVLMAYYGGNEHDTYFPTTRVDDLVYEKDSLTVKDAEMLGAVVDDNNPLIWGQTTFISNEGNSGKMYFTVNPSSVDLVKAGATFTLVNSIGEEAGIKLDTVRPSTEKLTFGYTGTYTRQKAPVSGNSKMGFYEATGLLDKNDIATAKIQIDPELKQAVKDFYNTNIRNAGSASNAIRNLDPSSFTQLANGIYAQFNGFADAYALKASWTDSLGAHDVYSNFGMAAVAVKPLSYAFLKDKNFPNLPKINPLSEFTGFNLDMSKIHFNINFHLGSADAHIRLKAFQLNLDTVDLVVRIPDVEYWKAHPDSAIRYKDERVDLDELEGYFNARFAEVVAGWNDSINATVNGQIDSLIANIDRQVNDFATDIEGQLNTSIQDMVDDAQGQVLGKVNNAINKVNNYIGKVNRVINKINSLLDNPNRFMQPVLLYEGADKHFHFVSTRKSIPSHFTGSGGIILHPTSYNAEIAAPAYKKFIAVTNVFKNGTSAQKGDSDCRAALDAVNAQPYFNQVIDGGRYGVAFVPQSGYTYEIFYSALDFSGRISQRKYYVTVD